MMKRLFAVLVAVLSVGALAAPAEAATNQAVVVIDTGDGTPRRATISFSESSITGIEALERAGANPVVRGYGGLGGAVCMIDGVGHPANPCFGPREFWAYYRAPGGATSWAFSPIGAGAIDVRDGDVEGWRWGTGGAPGESPVPVPPPPAPQGGGGGPSGGGGSGNPASPRDGATTNGGGSENPSGSTDATASPHDPQSPQVETERERNRDRNRDDEPDEEAQAAGLAGSESDGSDSGSPIGVLVAAAILAALVATAVIVQRRRRAPGIDVRT